jgi:hypothetical protein
LTSKEVQQKKIAMMVVNCMMLDEGAKRTEERNLKFYEALVGTSPSSCALNRVNAWHKKGTILIDAILSSYHIAPDMT